jgi:hypothetical protein
LCYNEKHQIKIGGSYEPRKISRNILEDQFWSMLSDPSIGMADLVFVPSDELEKEYEGNLFVGEKSYSRFILRSKQRKGLCSQAGELCIHIWGCSNVLGWRLEYFP